MNHYLNHYGYGLRPDEEFFAHKIPPGGNWRSLGKEEQEKCWNGKIPKGGGCTNRLRRRAWDEPAGTITTTPMQKLSCQLHPGVNDEREMYNLIHFDVTPTQPSNGLTAAELFCGGGLMAVGLKESGFSLVWANDFDKRAVQAYKHNLGDHVVHGDITTIDPDDIPDVDIIAGGPPCQDYSVAGKGEGENGERGKLVWAYLRIIERKQPKAFIFENVKGLIGKRHRHTFDALIEKFNEIGYTVSWKLVNAWDYGVAQKRERVFIVGVRKDLGFSFVFPEPKPEDVRTQVLRDVIGDLPDPTNQINGGRSKARFRGDGTQGDKLVDPGDASPTIRAEHHGNIEGFDPALINHNPKDLLDIRNHDEKSYWTPKSQYTYEQANRVQSMEKASATIPAHHNSGQPIHPSQAPRRFTVRECLRIQSVPDWYVMPDELSISAQYRIVGNGVASRVAWYLGRALGDQLTNRRAIT